MIEFKSLLGSPEPAPTATGKAAWAKEIERRVREIDDGAVELIDWEDVRAELLADE